MANAVEASSPGSHVGKYTESDRCSPDIRCPRFIALILMVNKTTAGRSLVGLYFRGRSYKIILLSNGLLNFISLI